NNNTAPHEEAAKTIVENLQRQQPRIEVLSYLLPPAEHTAEMFAQIEQAQPDLVLTLGTRATAAALSHRLDGVPLVFSMVLYPQHAGVLGSDVPGITLEVDPAGQFRLLRRLLPRARTVGVMYDPDQTGPMVEQAPRAAAR